MAKKAKKPTRPPKPKEPTPRAARAGTSPPSLAECDRLFEGVDEADLDVRNALTALENNEREILRAAEPHLVRYCEDVLAHLDAADRPKIMISEPSDIWKYVRLGFEMTVSRRQRQDSEDGVYVSVECGCDWDREHGLQIVIRDGRAVTKVGGFDGHLTNASAFANPAYVGVVYVPIF